MSLTHHPLHQQHWTPRSRWGACSRAGPWKDSFAAPTQPTGCWSPRLVPPTQVPSLLLLQARTAEDNSPLGQGRQWSPPFHSQSQDEHTVPSEPPPCHGRRFTSLPPHPGPPEARRHITHCLARASLAAGKRSVDRHRPCVMTHVRARAQT